MSALTRQFDQNADVNATRSFQLPGNFLVSRPALTATEIAIVESATFSSESHQCPKIAIKLLKRGAEIKHPYDPDFERAFFNIWDKQDRNDLHGLYDQLVDAIPSDYYKTVLSDSYNWKFNHDKRPQKEAQAKKIKLRFKRALADVLPLARQNRKDKYAEVTCQLEQHGLPKEIRRLVGRYTDSLPSLVGEDPVFLHRKTSLEKKSKG